MNELKYGWTLQSAEDISQWQFSIFFLHICCDRVIQLRIHSHWLWQFQESIKTLNINFKALEAAVLISSQHRISSSPVCSKYPNLLQVEPRYALLTRIDSTDDVTQFVFLQSLIGLTGLGPWGTFNASSGYIDQWSRISLQRKTSLLIGSPSLQKTALPHSNRDKKYWHLQNFSLKSRAALFQQKLFKLLVSNLSGHLNYASPVAILRVEIDPGNLKHCTRCSLVACKSWLYPVASWNLKERARMWLHSQHPTNEKESTQNKKYYHLN